MTNQDAIREFTGWINEINLTCTDPEMCLTDNITRKLKRDRGMAEQAIQALQKQIPNPPKYVVYEKYRDLGKNYYCECGVMFIDFDRNGTNFCGNCGQKLRKVK